MDNTTTKIITVKATNIWKSYGENTVLAGVSIEAEKGEIVAIVGPNGAGKTTLLRIIAGLEKADKGTITTRGNTLLVFQENLLLPWKKLRDNITLGLKYRRTPPHQASKALEQVAELLGLKNHLDKYPGQVSGGTARKAAIARMLVLNPDILLLDEPLAGLDLKSRENLATTLEAIARKGKTIIIVDHSLEDIARIADKVYILNGPPGKITAKIDLKNTKREEKQIKLHEQIAKTLRTKHAKQAI
ncbi:MAG: hypothetical protein DSY37_02410 [Hyperthermus sp.]|nr:MAG: hypothetical protein DSY37_02410 [Hyperthermus sp.]